MDTSDLLQAVAALEGVASGFASGDVGAIRAAIHSTPVPGLLPPVAALWAGELLDEVFGPERELAALEVLVDELAARVEEQVRLVLDPVTLGRFLLAPSRFAASFGYPTVLVWTFLRERYAGARSASAPDLSGLPEWSPQFAVLMDGAASQGAERVRGHLAAEVSVGLVAPLPDTLSIRLSVRNTLEAACRAAVEGDFDRFDSELEDLAILPHRGAEFAAAVAFRALDHFVATPARSLEQVSVQVAGRFPGVNRPLLEMVLLAVQLSHSTLLPSQQLPSTRLLALTVAALCEGRAVASGAPGRVWGGAARAAFAELLPAPVEVPASGETVAQDPLPAFGLPLGFYGSRYLVEVDSYVTFTPEELGRVSDRDDVVLLVGVVSRGLSAAWVVADGVTPAGPAFATLRGTGFVLTGDDSASRPPARLERTVEETVAVLDDFGGVPPLP